VVAVRISRESIEVGAEAAAIASVTRLDAEVATPAQATTTTIAAKISRISFEVLSPRPQVASVTRLDAEVATPAQATTTTIAAKISRASIEVGSRIVKRASVTRLDAEVATKAQATSTTATVQVSRVSAEMLARRGSTTMVSPLALASGIEVFLHNWVDEAVLRSAYETDISTSPNTGAESRRSLTVKPSRTLELLWQIHSSDDEQRFRFDKLLLTLRKITDERLAVPLYMDQRELGVAYTSFDDTVFFDTTRGRWFIGARVVIVEFDWDGSYLFHSFHLISSLQSDRLVFASSLGVAVSANAVILPMIDCEVILEAKAKYFSAGNIAIKLELQEIAGSSQLPALKSDFPSDTDSFDDAPIFDYDPDWVDGIEKGRIRQGQRYRQGRTDRVYTAAARSREWHKLNLTGLRASCAANVREDIWRVVEFFDTRRGRTRSFWNIDQEQVWKISSIDASGGFVSVDEINDFNDFKEELEGGWIGLVMSDGTKYVREAVTVQQILTVFRITVNPPLPVNLDVDQVFRVATARRVRFDKDELEERWKHTGYMGTTLELIETLEENSVET
jgi:hypothetical protein